MIKVLDHGYVRLVSYTQPALHDEISQGRAVTDVIPTEWTGDLEVVRNARVSYNAEWRTGEDTGKDEKLLHYLMEHQHTTPLEAMVFTFEVKAPIFVFRQWHRHRTWSYNEVSARYTELPSEVYVPDPKHIGIQSTTNKQQRVIDEQIGKEPFQQHIADSIRDSVESSFITYKLLLSLGCPRELARGVLPLNTYSHMFATVDLHNLLHFLTLRLDPHAQWEIRKYAKALLNLITPVVPVIAQAYKALRGNDILE